MPDQSLYSRALFLLSVARETNRRAMETVSQLQAQYERERATWESHIAGLREVVKSQRKRIAELDGDI